MKSFVAFALTITLAAANAGLIGAPLAVAQAPLALAHPAV
ncbi:unnamed protein product, partial [Allacma fusca]